MTTLSIRQYLLKRSDVEKLLVASTFFSCTLVLLRIMHAHSTIFIFMVWNLFLAYVPYVLSTWLTTRLRKPVRLNTADIAIVITWVLFIPNTFYILTDLYHLADSQNPHIPQWLDLILIFSFAWNGLLLGILSIRQMEKLLPGKDPFRNTVFVMGIMFLSSLGVYIGRYLRYNSWDIVSNPFRLTADMLNMITHPLQNGQAWGMIVCFTILLTFMYNMLKKLSQALN